jgi:hypothetical protein
MEGALLPFPPETENDVYEPKMPDVDFCQALAHLLNRETVIEDVGSPFFTRVTVSVNEWGTIVKISWQMATEATSLLEYDTNEDLSAAQEISADIAGFHEVELTQINPGETVYFRISATETGNGSTSYHTSILRFDVPAVPTVLPPLYGRWHAARSFVECPEPSDKPWLHQLNVDPRYRAAAGLGALVVQKRQNALMASAWEQLGAIAVANDLVRRAQLGRALSGAIHDRLSTLALDDFLQITGPVHKRTRLDRCPELYDEATMGITPYVHFRDKTDVPGAVFDPAFRRIARPRGPFRKRQVGGDPGQGDFVQKICNGRFLFSVDLHFQGDLEAGVPSEDFRQEFESKGITLSLKLTIEQVEPGKWRIKEYDSSRTYIVSRQDEALNVYAELRAAGPHHEPEGTLSVSTDARFADVRGSEEVVDLLGIPDSAPGEDPVGEPPEEEIGPATLDQIRDATSCALSPENTICDRTRQQIELSDDSEVVCFERIMAYPEFPQPMYSALQEISQDLLIPGLERIPQNSITLLLSNRSFIESFMVGLNHELARELLWREYPTDQRGSYARQFWDPSDCLPGKEMRDDLERWQERLKDIRALHEWDDRLGEHRVPFKEDEEPIEEKVVLVIRGDLLKKHPNTRIYAIPAKRDIDGEPIPYLKEFEDRFGSDFVIESPASEDLEFLDNRVISTNLGAQLETLGILLPVAYDIEVTRVGEEWRVIDQDNANFSLVFKKENDTLNVYVYDYPEPITSIFGGQLEPDITFLGFPFDASDARSDPTSDDDSAADGIGTTKGGEGSRSDPSQGMGYFFVFEERPMEIRFGLDVAAGDLIPDYLSNLAWGHVGIVDGTEDAFGYIDIVGKEVRSGNYEVEPDWEVWNSTLSSARIASITLQKAFRMSVHADRLIEA